MIMPALLPVLVAAMSIHRMWFALPLVVVVSLVYSATRHEQMAPMLAHAVRFAAWIVVFMIIVLGVLMTITWLI